MAELRRDLDFTQESRRPDKSREVGFEDFDRHLTPMLQIIGEIDRRGAPASELPDYAVASRERGSEPGGDVFPLANDWRGSARFGHGDNIARRPYARLSGDVSRAFNARR